MTTTELEQQFISDIADELFEKENGKRTENEVLFRLRFNRDNYELPNEKDTAEKDINKLMESAGFKGKNIQRILRSVIDLILDKYFEEMSGDMSEKDLNDLKNTERGKGKIWQIVFKWLWDYKFSRWVETNFWSCLEKRAEKNLDWMNLQNDAEMTMVERLHIPKAKAKKTLKVSVEKPYWAFISLPESDGYLLLLNHGVVSQCVVCPSQAFALDYQLEKIRLLPQKESLASEEGCNFTFNEIGKENFVAIALEKPLDLAWLKPNEEEVAPELTGKRMEELWQELEKQDNWRVYSQQVEVVG